MKTLIKRFGIVAAAAAVGLLFAGCADGDGNADPAPAIRTAPGPAVGFGPGPGSQPASALDGIWDGGGGDVFIFNRGNWVQWWAGGEEGFKGTYAIFDGNRIALALTGIFIDQATAGGYGFDAGWVDVETWLDVTFDIPDSTFEIDGAALTWRWGQDGSAVEFQRRE